MSFYRFSNGVFIEATSYEEAQNKLIDQIKNEKEDPKRWYKCTCVGLSHRFGCYWMNRDPETGEIEIPF